MTAVQFLLRMRRFAYYAVASFVSVIVLYVAAAAVFLLFPANADVQAATLQTRIDNAAHVAPKVRIYVLSNGVHTDVVLPVKSDAFRKHNFCTYLMMLISLRSVGGMQNFICKRQAGRRSNSAPQYAHSWVPIKRCSTLSILRRASFQKGSFRLI